MLFARLIARFSVAHCSPNAFCIAETGENQVLNGLERSQALLLVWITDGFLREDSKREV